MEADFGVDPAIIVKCSPSTPGESEQAASSITFGI
jgi:hypothetical protein